METIVPIVYASDENFLLQTYVSIYSVLANRKKKYFFKFFIMVPKECKEIEYDVSWQYVNYSIEYLKVSKTYFEDTDITLQNITKPTFYRLLIPNYLKQYDKCIYLDGDTICCNDILELYNIDLEDNFIAASKGAIINFNKLSVAEILDIPDATDYINAGVLVMNLELMRKKNMVEKFIEHSEKRYPCQDQDVLNKCCYGKIKLLAMKNNVYCNVFSAPKSIVEQRFNDVEIEEALSAPVIIHYPREYSKPWKNIKAAEGDRWWKYAAKAIDSNKLNPLRDTAENWLTRYDYHKLFMKIEQNTNIVLFGYSEIGCMLCDEIEKKYPQRIRAFCDNDKKKQELTYKTYTVINAERLKERYSNALVVVTSQNYSEAIKKQLLELGFKEEQLVIYRKKTIDYVYSFRKSSIDNVCRDIVLDKISLQDCVNSGVVQMQKYIER